MSSPGQLVIHSSGAGHVIAEYRPLLMICFQRAPEPREIELIEELVQAGLEDGVSGGILYVVARPDFKGGVDPKLRSMLERVAKVSTRGESGENAVVILTQGFGGAVARGVLAGIVLLSSDRKKIRVFAKPEEACAWLASTHGLEGDMVQNAWSSARRALV